MAHTQLKINTVNLQIVSIVLRLQGFIENVTNYNLGVTIV